MKNILRFFLSFTLLLSGILSFAGKKSSDNFACPTATISYVGTPFCSSDTSVKAVTLTGTDAYLGGVFSSTSGLTLNPTTGAITPNTSTPGVYTITYTIAANGSCPALNITTYVTISPSNTVSVASSTPTLCINTPLTPITHTTTGATNMGTPTNLPVGITATWSGNTITISGTPAMYGVYNYSIPLPGGCGTTFATGTINVLMSPGNLTISGGTTACAGTPVNLTITGSPGVVVTMTTNGGTQTTYTLGASGVITISVTPTVTTTYTLTSASLNGCSIPLNQSLTVTVNQSPQFITQIPDIYICNGEMLNIASQLTSTVPGATFVWQATTSNINMVAISGDETNIDQIVNLINPLQNGTINIEVMPHVGSCSGSSQQILIIVNPIPAITSTIANQTPICNNEVVTITTVSSSSATAYNWQVINANNVQIVGGVTSGTSATGIINAQLALINSSVAGTISFEITPVNGICNGTPIFSDTITVNPIPGSPIYSPSPQICSGETTNLTISTSLNIAGTMLEWTVTDSQNVTGFTANGIGLSPISINDVLFNTSNVAGSVTYSVTTKLGDCEGGTTNYVVNVLPLPNLSVLIDGEITIDTEGNLTPYVLDTGLDTFNHTFEWYLNGTLISNANSNSYTASEEGEYAVHVTSVVTNCSNFANATVTETTIENEELTDLVMYPNPTFDSLSFNNINKVMSVQISNQMGQTILYKDLNSKTGTVDLSDLNVGIYNVVFETESGIVNQRIIKQ